MSTDVVQSFERFILGKYNAMKAKISPFKIDLINFEFEVGVF
tara:strand:+ start:352 stop:477 length:126 start_codon:yes stop_codon:yes gene_type:complete